MEHNNWLDSLEKNGFAIMEHFLDTDTVGLLNTELDRKRKHGLLSKAGIGKGKKHQIRAEVRGDNIHWVTDNSYVTDLIKPKIDYLVHLINRTFYAGINDWELQFAYYPVGTFYKRHKDQFDKDDQRKISMVFYLNNNWQEKDGGELVIYGQEAMFIPPQSGTLALFFSDLEHEVLPTYTERYSVTAWLKRNNNILHQNIF